MGFQVSPGVAVREIDLSTVIPAVSSTEGAIAGVFRWGPVDQRILIDSEPFLANRFGKPTNFNAETFFTASNFLSYGNKLYVVRAADITPTIEDETIKNDGVLSALGVVEGGSVEPQMRVNFVVKNDEHYDDKLELSEFSKDTDVQFLARFPGAMGNSLRVSVCDSADAYHQELSIAEKEEIADTSALTITVGSNKGIVTVANSATGVLSDVTETITKIKSAVSVGDVLEVGDDKIGTQFLQVRKIGEVVTATKDATIELEFDNVLQLSANVSSNKIVRNWEFFNSVDSAPSQSVYQSTHTDGDVEDELHIVVVDEGGKFTDIPGTILEVYPSVSRATDCKLEDGTGNYYADVIRLNSQYIHFANPRAGADVGLSTEIKNSTNATPLSIRFSGGQDGEDEATVKFSVLAFAYDLYRSAEDVDISLVLQGKARGSESDNYGQLANYIIDNICDSRKDCVAFISPDRADVVNNYNKECDAVIAYRNSLRSTSYALMDSGYKYQYDKYNDVFRWIPLNGDMAGLCVRTDDVRDPWWSPAGFNRGQIKNIIKLAWNPRKAFRDQLYKNGVNPVTTFPGDGTVLFGDKTLQAKPSAFDRINVRRLFIVLEKAIATASKYTLFEFNDDFTRSQFSNMVNPFLRDVKGRRGIYDFKVVCDSTNNSGEVIDRNEFVADIYIKPARSINFITLSFVAVKTGVEFSEVVGKF